MKRRQLNLLTWQFRLHLVARERLRLWLAVLAVVCVVALGAWQIKASRLGAAQESLTLLESRCAPLHTMRGENQRMSLALADIRGHQSLLTRLDDEQIPLRLLSLVSRGVQRCSGDLRVQRIAVTRTQQQVPVPQLTAAKQPPSGPRYQETTSLRIDGVADDNLAISQFVASLRDSGVFANVDLKSAVGARGQQGGGQTFLVEGTLARSNAPRSAASSRPTLPPRRW